MTDQAKSAKPKIDPQEAEEKRLFGKIESLVPRFLGYAYETLTGDVVAVTQRFDQRDNLGRPTSVEYRSENKKTMEKNLLEIEKELVLKPDHHGLLDAKKTLNGRIDDVKRMQGNLDEIAKLQQIIYASDFRANRYSIKAEFNAAAAGRYIPVVLYFKGVAKMDVKGDGQVVPVAVINSHIGNLGDHSFKIEKRAYTSEELDGMLEDYKKKVEDTKFNLSRPAHPGAIDYRDGLEDLKKARKSLDEGIENEKTGTKPLKEIKRPEDIGFTELQPKAQSATFRA